MKAIIVFLKLSLRLGFKSELVKCHKLLTKVGEKYKEGNRLGFYVMFFVVTLCYVLNYYMFSTFTILVSEQIKICHMAEMTNASKLCM